MRFGCGPCNNISWMKKNNWKADIKKKKEKKERVCFWFLWEWKRWEADEIAWLFLFCSYSSWSALVLRARVILLWQNWLAKEHKRDNSLAHSTRSCSLKPLIHILQSACLNQIIIPISWFTAQSIMIAIPWGKRMVILCRSLWFVQCHCGYIVYYNLHSTINALLFLTL